VNAKRRPTLAEISRAATKQTADWMNQQLVSPPKPEPKSGSFRVPFQFVDSKTTRATPAPYDSPDTEETLP
jgi:hypothetical protein